MAKKYEFITQPPKGEFGEWKTADGFKGYTNERAQAVRWYKKYLEKKNNK